MYAVFVVEDEELDDWLQPCSVKCCMDDSPDTQPKPLPSSAAGTTSLEKRVLWSPANFQGSSSEFIKGMCNDYAQLVQLDHAAAFHEAAHLRSPVYTCLGRLHGCTGIVIISQTYLWILHIVENPVSQNPALWDFHVRQPLRDGGAGSNIPPGRGLRYLAAAGQPLSPQFHPQAYIITPYTKRSKFGVQQWTIAYPNLVSYIAIEINSILGVQTRAMPYVATAAAEYNFRNNWSPEMQPDVNLHDAVKPFQLPFGKTLIMYDPNLYNYPQDAQRPRGQQRWAGWQIWLADGQQAQASWEWSALPSQ